MQSATSTNQGISLSGFSCLYSPSLAFGLEEVVRHEKQRTNTKNTASTRGLLDIGKTRFVGKDPGFEGARECDHASSETTMGASSLETTTISALEKNFRSKARDLVTSLTLVTARDWVSPMTQSTPLDSLISWSYLECEGRTVGTKRPEVLAVLTEPVRRGPYKKDRGPIFSQYGPEQTRSVRDLLYDF